MKEKINKNLVIKSITALAVIGFLIWIISNLKSMFGSDASLISAVQKRITAMKAYNTQWQANWLVAEYTKPKLSNLEVVDIAKRIKESEGWISDNENNLFRALSSVTTLGDSIRVAESFRTTYSMDMKQFMYGVCSSLSEINSLETNLKLIKT